MKKLKEIGNVIAHKVHAGLTHVDSPPKITA